MKRKTIIFLCFIFLIIFAGCTDSRYPLNGIWYANVNNNDCVAVFMDDHCFLRFGEYIDKLNFTCENGKGTFSDSSNEGLDFIVKGNVLTILVDNNQIVLNKDRKTKAAHEAVKGVWNGPDGWLFAFINDKVFLVSDYGFADYGTYFFENNTGGFKSAIWEYDVNFLINDNTLDAMVVGWYEEDITFIKEQ